ncbi:hypothetical protein BDV24DRAFT_133981 [Aspergillus arachidicola]|uniref:Uncharacterized protein n=1 Tax=Aspergillus arachidicola TaxID=656916 RepID=A0A5N6Y5Y0_9EURO|nr:hypothetical protein BDV24DRAFT_133981 [Aspergillus arachidicola]
MRPSNPVQQRRGFIHGKGISVYGIIMKAGYVVNRCPALPDRTSLGTERRPPPPYRIRKSESGSTNTTSGLQRWPIQKKATFAL